METARGNFTFPVRSRKDVAEKLEKMTEGFPATIYESVGGEMVPVARLSRHPDCPPERYEEFLKTMFTTKD